MINKNDKKALKSGVWYVMINVLIKFIGFLSLPIFLRIMNENEVGKFETFNSFLSLMLPIITLSFSSSIAVAKFEFKNNINDYIKSVLVLGSFISIAFFLVTILIWPFIRSIINIDFKYLLVLYVYSVFAPSLDMLQTKSRLEYNYVLSSILSLISGGLFVIVSLIITHYAHNKLNGRIYGYYIPMIILCICVYIYFVVKSNGVKRQYWRFCIVVSVPLVFHTVSGVVLSLFDRIMIDSMIGDKETAHYSVAYSCAMIIEILWYSLNQAWAPWAYEKMDKNEGDILKKISKIYLIVFGIIVVFFMLLSPEVLWFIGGNTYKFAKDVIPPVMCGFVFQLVYSLYVNIETLEKKTIYVAIGTMIASLVNIVLNFFLLPLFGYVAAAYTTLIGYIVLFCLHFLFVYKMKKTYWYDSSFNISFLFVFLVISCIIKLLYNYTVIRYSIILFLLVITVILLFKYKKIIKELLGVFFHKKENNLVGD